MRINGNNVGLGHNFVSIYEPFLIVMLFCNVFCF